MDGQVDMSRGYIMWGGCAFNSLPPLTHWVFIPIHKNLVHSSRTVLF